VLVGGTETVAGAIVDGMEMGARGAVGATLLWIALEEDDIDAAVG